MSDDPRAEQGPELPPGPPYPLDLIADLHAGVLDEEVASALWPRMRDDPHAARVLTALDATRDDLATSAISPEAPPPAVTAAIETTLAAIRADGGSPSTAGAADDVESLEDARARLRDGRRRRGMVIASIAAGVVAVVTLGVALLTASMSSQGSVTTADGPVTTSPAAASSAPVSSAAVAPAALLAVLGRSSPIFTVPGPDSGPERLSRCLAANGVAPSVQVVGSGPIEIDGRAAVVILLSTGQAGRFDALVVGLDCDTDSAATLSRTELGAPLPSR